MANSENQAFRKIILTLTNDYLKLPERARYSPMSSRTEGPYANLSTLSGEDHPLPKKMFTVGPKQISGESVEFDATAEPWSQFKLADGSEVKVKIVMLNAARLDDFTDAGDPMYQFQFQQIISVVAPDSLKRKAQ